MAKVTCIDISCWQKNVDFNKIKLAGITAVIIRAGFGREVSQKDSEFETHYKNAKANGLKIGAYWYSYAVSVEDAKQEAKACLACIKGKSFDMPIYFDMEDSSQTKLGKAILTDMAKAFCETIKSGGYRAGVYANLNWFTNYLDYNILKKSYSIWLAQYHSTNQLDCDIWQNSSSGKINGVSGNCDTNIIYNNSVFSSSTNNNTSPKPITTTNKSTISIKSGLKLSLKDAPLYASSSIKTKATSIAGTYYLWDNQKVNGRYRITNSKANVGKNGQVTGWIDSKYITNASNTINKTKSIKPGLKLSLKCVPLYGSSSNATKATVITGTYYLWDNQKINDRYRITNSKSNVGKNGQVTGWIDSKYVK